MATIKKEKEFLSNTHDTFEVIGSNIEYTYENSFLNNKSEGVYQ